MYWENYIIQNLQYQFLSPIRATGLGCKIKALRAKTNTYIKTPVRGEDSVFVVTGRKEDVDAAKQEILSAAEHFTQIRASRRHSQVCVSSARYINTKREKARFQMIPVQGGAPAPGHVTAFVRVPYKFVGLVVGPKGATIKRIQQQTHTYIITPSRDKEPIFEVTGLADNVEAARREIEAHIGSRTGQPLPPAFADGSAAGSDYGRWWLRCNLVSNLIFFWKFFSPDSLAMLGDSSAPLSFDLIATATGATNQHSQPNGSSRSASVLLSEFRSNGTETPCCIIGGGRPNSNMAVNVVQNAFSMSSSSHQSQATSSGESSLVSSLGAPSSTAIVGASRIFGGGSVICKPQPTSLTSYVDAGATSDLLFGGVGPTMTSVIGAGNGRPFNAFTEQPQVRGTLVSNGFLM